MKGLIQLTCLSILIAGTPLAHAKKKPHQDVKGSKDHPLIGRYLNSYIKQYTLTDYDEYEFATGPVTKTQKRPPIKKIEGKVITIIYYGKTKTESVLKVYRNFMIAFKRIGIKQSFACSNAECGPKFFKKLFAGNHRKGQYQQFGIYNTVPRTANFRFWNGVLNKDGKTYHVTLAVKLGNHGVYPIRILLDIVESKKMATDMVAINMEMLEKSFVQTGQAVLDGIYFDHNKASLKPSSNGALAEIAKYLKKYSQLKVYIVGHTDNSGGYDYNLKLSRARAGAVVNELSTRYNISKTRLRGVGVGEVAPVASNTDEQGRKKNRRVVMVLMGKG